MIVYCDFDNMHCETQGKSLHKQRGNKACSGLVLEDLQRQKQEEVLLKGVVLLPDQRLRPTGPDSGPGVKH